MAAYNNDVARTDDVNHPYDNLLTKAAPRMVSLADTVRGLEKQCECLHDDVQRLTTLLAATREELALLSQRTFGQEPSR